MRVIRIFVLAHDLQLDSQVLLGLCEEAGVKVRHALATITLAERDRVVQYLKSRNIGNLNEVDETTVQADSSSRMPITRTQLRPGQNVEPGDMETQKYRISTDLVEELVREVKDAMEHRDHGIRLRECVSILEGVLNLTTEELKLRSPVAEGVSLEELIDRVFDAQEAGKVEFFTHVEREELHYARKLRNSRVHRRFRSSKGVPKSGPDEKDIEAAQKIALRSILDIGQNLMTQSDYLDFLVGIIS